MGDPPAPSGSLASFSIPRRLIAELRKARGLTQAYLAEKMRRSVQYVGLLERGKENVTLGNLSEIANMLGVTFDDLIRKPKRRALLIPKRRPRKHE